MRARCFASLALLAVVVGPAASVVPTATDRACSTTAASASASNSTSAGSQPVTQRRGRRHRCRDSSHYVATAVLQRETIPSRTCATRAAGTSPTRMRSCSDGSTASSRTPSTAASSPTPTSAFRSPIRTTAPARRPHRRCRSRRRSARCGARSQLPLPVVGVNPVSRGVTGLTTRLWSGGAADRAGRGDDRRLHGHRHRTCRRVPVRHRRGLSRCGRSRE